MSSDTYFSIKLQDGEEEGKAGAGDIVGGGYGETDTSSHSDVSPTLSRGHNNKNGIFTPVHTPVKSEMNVSNCILKHASSQIL